jgi:hypothetical protein
MNNKHSTTLQFQTIEMITCSAIPPAPSKTQDYLPKSSKPLSATEMHVGGKIINKKSNQTDLRGAVCYFTSCNINHIVLVHNYGQITKHREHSTTEDYKNYVRQGTSKPFTKAGTGTICVFNFRGGGEISKY